VPYTGNTTDIALRDIEMGKDDRFNVDIMYTIVGGAEPPELPLRQELLPQGVEMVYNAKGVGQKVVCKEQDRREKILLETLKDIESKLESKRSYQRTCKREKALSKITELRIRMEHCSRTISYEMYLEELRRLIDTNNKTEASREDVVDAELENLSAFTNHDGTVNTNHVESQLQEALEMYNDTGSEGSGFHLSDAESLDHSNDHTNASLLSNDTVGTVDITDLSSASNSDESDRGNATKEKRESPTSSLIGEQIDEPCNINDPDDDEDEGDSISIWKTVMVDGGSSISSKTHLTTASGLTTAASNISKKAILRKQGSTGSVESLGSVVKSPSSSSVRFKDVKVSLEDNLARARALIENARTVQRNFSSDSNSSSIKPSNSSTNGRTPHILDEGCTSEKERYHLFVSHACPWSHRVLIVRALKGLEDTVGVSYIKCSWTPQPLWDASITENPDKDVSFWSIDKDHGAGDDDVFATFKASFLTESRQRTKVPVLWDRITKTVVGNTSSEIMWRMNFDFNKWARKPKLNLFPAGKRGEIEDTNRWLHDALSVGVYQCGLATSQQQYNNAIHNLTDALDKANMIVQTRGFLNGSKLTASDLRLFVVLIRMDEIYRVLFQTNTRRISAMPGLMDYMRDIYHAKGVKETCDVNAMRIEYFSARTEKGREFIIPRGGMFMKLLDVGE
jgi:putative glutathione S-transferase